MKYVIALTMLLCGLGATAQKYTLVTNDSIFRKVKKDQLFEIIDRINYTEAHFVIYYVPRVFRKGWVIVVNSVEVGAYEAVDYSFTTYLEYDLNFVKTIVEEFEK